MRLLAVAIASVGVFFAPACGASHRFATFRDRAFGLAFQYPANWIIAPPKGLAGERVSPPRLAVLSFSLARLVA
jgi:hypothetical protein